ATLDEERLIRPELEERADDRAERVVVPGRFAGAAVDDEILRALRDLAVEVVEEHAERRLGRPLARVQLGAARRTDRREVAAERLDARVADVRTVHCESPQ